MRIGICTQPLATNYGGILQNYALQVVLKRMGHDVWTLDISKYTWKDWFMISLRVLIHKLLFHRREFPLTPTKKKNIGKNLKCFIDNNINLTSPNLHWFNKSIVDKFQFQSIIVGSDQTWRPKYNLRIEDMYLAFLKDMNLKKIAYAASFGTDSWEYNIRQTETCSELAKQFSAISVREISGVDLCRKYLHVEATHVLDPTLLLNAEDYKDVCRNIEKKNPFVFAYILDMSQDKVVKIKEFALSKGLPYMIVGADSKVQQDDSVEKWLSLFRDAAYIITDSFHGTAFSINFNKDFFVYANDARGNSRFKSLLTLLGLEHRIVRDEMSNLDSYTSINWDVVNRRLDDERVLSYNWLINNLQ